MGRKISIVLAVVVVGMLLLPALASATLVNEYGMHYAGQAMCLGCHARMDPDTLALHGRFATSGVLPTAPEAWTAFQAPGAIPPVAGTGQISYTAGGSYSITGLDWVTLGDSSEEGNSATEYLFFKGSSDPTVMPWNIVEGLSWEPSGEWMVAARGPRHGSLRRDLRLPALPHAGHHHDRHRQDRPEPGGQTSRRRPARRCSGPATRARPSPTS